MKIDFSKDELCFLLDAMQAHGARSLELSCKMREFQSTKDKMMKTIVDETIVYYKKVVVDLVKEDPQMTKMLDIVRQVVTEKFPDMVHDSMVSWFARHMDSVASEVINARIKSDDCERVTKEIKSRFENMQSVN